MKLKSILSFSLLIGFLLSFTTVEANTILHDPVGTYDFTVSDIPDLPDVKGVMVLSRENGKVKLTMTADGTTSTLDKVELSGHNLKAELSYDGMVLKLSGKFSGNNFEGQFNTDFGPLTVTAEKQ